MVCFEAQNFLIVVKPNLSIVCVLVCWGYHNIILQTEWFKQHKLVFSQFWKLEVQVQGITGFDFSEASFLGLQMVTFPIPHMAFPKYMYILGVSLPSYTDTSQIGLRFINMTSLNLITSLEAHSLNTVTL